MVFSIDGFWMEQLQVANNRRCLSSTGDLNGEARFSWQFARKEQIVPKDALA